MRMTSSATRARSSAAMSFPSMMRAVMSVPCLSRLGRGQFFQDVAKLTWITVDRHLLEPRGGAGQNPDPRLWHTERLRQQFGHGTIGFAALGNGAHPDLHHRPAIRQRFDSVNSVAATARCHAQGDADALGGIAPRVHREESIKACSQMTLG